MTARWSLAKTERLAANGINLEGSRAWGVVERPYVPSPVVMALQEEINTTMRRFDDVVAEHFAAWLRRGQP